jgi:hypothetical protein
MLQTQQTKDLRWLYLKNDESSESENVVDEEKFDHFDEIPLFVTSMIRPRIRSFTESQKFQKTKTATESSKMIA